MKRKELLAKSLAVGLAIAMAASSMSVPGGLLAPVEAMAETTPAQLDNSNKSTYFTITTPVTLPESGSLTDADVVGIADGKTAEQVGTYEVSWKKGDEAATTPTAAGTYTVLVKITAAGTELEAASGDPVELGEVTVYEAFKGTLSITSDHEIGTPRIGDTLTASVAGEDADQKNQYNYTWFRQEGSAQATEIAGQTDATYELTTDDVDNKISVKISAKDDSFEAQTSEATAVVKKKAYDNSTLPAEGDTFEWDETAKKLKIKDSVSLGDLQYTLNGGATDADWQDLPADKEIPLDGKAYDGGKIKVRVKATDDTEASEPVVYTKKIEAELDGSVSITGDSKFGATLTATPSGTQQGAVLKYQFIRVKDGGETPIPGATDSTYTLVKEDIGATIKVKVTADGYSGELTSVATSQVTPAAKRATAANVATKVADKANETYTYTLTALDATKGTPKYACEQGELTAPSASVQWKSAAEFTGLTPGAKYTFFATYEDDACYEASDVAYAAVTIDKLTHDAFSFNVEMTGSADEGKTVTVTPPFTGALCQIGDGSYEAVYTRTYTKEQISSMGGSTEITIKVKYPEDEKYADQCEQTKTIDLGKDSQAAPAAAAVTFTVNPAKTAYKPVITPPTDGEGNALANLQYSTDGTTFADDTTSIESQELAAGAEFKLYIRFKAHDNYNESNATLTTANAPAASAKPVITIKPSNENETTATISAGAGAEIRYTTDGSAPTKDSALYTAGTEITVADGATVKAIAIEADKIMSEAASETFTKGTTTPDTPGGNTGGSGSTGSGGGSGSDAAASSDPGKPTTETKPDGTTVTTTEEKKADGSVVTTTEEKKPDGSTKTAVEEKKADGSATVTTQEKKADGTAVNGVEEKKPDGSSSARISLENKDTGVQATVDVAKDTTGKVTEAKAAVTQTVPDKTAKISAAVVGQIVESAGTKDVTVTQKVVGENGKTVCKVTVNIADLSAGSDMKVLKINKKTGEMSLINKSTYTVAEDGSIAMDDLKTANYVLVPADEAEAFSNEVIATVKVEKSKKSVAAGKKTKITLSDDLNMDNVAKVTYTTSKKAVATVSKNGTITAKKAGKVTVKAKVTLKNGKTKTVKMTVTVKKQK